jgi:hypothetical protein
MSFKKAMVGGLLVGGVAFLSAPIFVVRVQKMREEKTKGQWYTFACSPHPVHLVLL